MFEWVQGVPVIVPHHAERQRSLSENCTRMTVCSFYSLVGAFPSPFPLPYPLPPLPRPFPCPFLSLFFLALSLLFHALALSLALTFPSFPSVIRNSIHILRNYISNKFRQNYTNMFKSTFLEMLLYYTYNIWTLLIMLLLFDDNKNKWQGNLGRNRKKIR